MFPNNETEPLLDCFSRRYMKKDIIRVQETQPRNASTHHAHHHTRHARLFIGGVDRFVRQDIEIRILLLK